MTFVESKVIDIRELTQNASKKISIIEKENKDIEKKTNTLVDTAIKIFKGTIDERFKAL